MTRLFIHRQHRIVNGPVYLISFTNFCFTQSVKIVDALLFKYSLQQVRLIARRKWETYWSSSSCLLSIEAKKNRYDSRFFLLLLLSENTTSIDQKTKQRANDYSGNYRFSSLYLRAYVWDLNFLRIENNISSAHRVERN